MNNLNNKVSIPSSWKNQALKQSFGTGACELFNQPDQLIAAENMQAFSFIPKVSGSPSAARLELLVTSGTPAAETFDISGFNGLNAILTSSITPTFNQFFADGTNTVSARQQVARAIVTELNNNLAFVANYEVFAEDAKITIQARVNSPSYNLTVNTLPSSITLLVNVAGVAEFAYEDLLDYSVYTETYVGTGDYGDFVDRLEYDLVGNVDLPFSSDRVYMNVQGITKNYVDIELPRKKLNVGIDVKLLDDEAIDAGRQPILAPYFIAYYDSFRYSTNSEKKRSLEGVSDVIWCQNAAQHKLNAYFLEDYVWDAGSTSSFKWLTDRPQLTPVTYDSHQYLQVIFKKNAKATGNFFVELTVHFYDGTSQTELFGAPSGFPYSGLTNNVSFDVSPNVLGLSTIESIAGKEIDWYEVSVKWFKTITSPVYQSEKKSYKFLRRCGDQSDNVIWFNKFGGWDSLEFLGTKAVAKNRSTSEVNRVLPFTANQKVGTNGLAVEEEVRLVHSIKSNDDISLTSTLLPNGHYQWVGGILESPATFIWDKQLKRYRAIVINSFEYSYNTELDEFAIRITFNYTVDNNTITR